MLELRVDGGGFTVWHDRFALYRDGRARIATRDRPRPFEVRLAGAEVEGLTRALDEAGFDELPSRLDGMVMDLPRVTVVYRGRTVHFLRGASVARIDRFQRLVDEIIRRERGRSGATDQRDP